MNGPPASLLFAAAVVLVAAAALLARRLFYCAAAPDEWLVRIRDGRLVEAGVGIAVWRRPGEVVARFSSTLQRVGFAGEFLDAERLKLAMEGFILWSVGAEGDSPFVAFRSLGLANLMHPPAGLKHPKHLLTSPQHKAFQQIVLACVQRHAGALALDEILRDQDAFVAGLAARLRGELEPLGLELGQVQVLSVRPADAALMRDLGAPQEERIREEAARIRLEAAERTKLRESEQQRAVRLQQLEAGAAVRRREQELEREQELQSEARALELHEARRVREEAELAAGSERLRVEAGARRDAALLLLEVDERKPQAVRDHELAVLAAEKLAGALRITDARWIGLGGDSPVTALASALRGLRELTAPAAPSQGQPRGGG